MALAQAAPGPKCCSLQVIGFKIGGERPVLVTMPARCCRATDAGLYATRMGERYAAHTRQCGNSPAGWRADDRLLADDRLDPARRPCGRRRRRQVVDRPAAGRRHMALMLRTKLSPVGNRRRCNGRHRRAGVMGSAVKTLLVVVLSGAALYAGLLGLLWWGQERLLFMPQRLPAQHRFMVDADVVETWVDVPGARLNALHLRLPQPQGVVFFLHGNAGNLDSWFTNADFYRRANVDLFTLDYRGYGKSSGRIQSQEQLLADVRAAWAELAPQYAGKQRVIYGRSLGSGLAAMLAAEVQPELTVLVSPYFSMANSRASTTRGYRPRC